MGDGRMTAVLTDGPLKGTTAEIDPVEGRPPKTVDLPCDDGTVARYCLSDWNQSGQSADYSFLYDV
jgi:hypothetical protein